MRTLVSTIGACIVLFAWPAAAQLGLDPLDHSKDASVDWSPGNGQSWCGYIAKCRPCIKERVIDGDTLELSCSRPEGPEKMILRLADIDAPERDGKAKCDKERELAGNATLFLVKMLPDYSPLDVIVLGRDRDNRTIGVARYKDRDIGAELVWHGHARPWPKNGTKPNWCD